MIETTPPPFILWTFQRTGGTSLAAALEFSVSGSEVLHEPFNPGRKLQAITRALRQGDADAARAGLRIVFEQGTCFKHCHELRSQDLTRRLVEVVAGYPQYRHVVLHRRSEVDRLCSLYLARQTAVWGKWKARQGGYREILDGRGELEAFPVADMIRHGQHCQSRSDWLDRLLGETGIKALETTFESLYLGSRADREAQFRRVFDYLERPLQLADERIEQRLFANDQGSERLLSRVPNIEEARQELDAALGRAVRGGGTGA